MEEGERSICYFYLLEKCRRVDQIICSFIKENFDIIFELKDFLKEIYNFYKDLYFV